MCLVCAMGDSIDSISYGDSDHDVRREERLKRRREQYRLRMARETPEEREAQLLRRREYIISRGQTLFHAGRYRLDIISAHAKRVWNSSQALVVQLPGLLITSKRL